MRMQRKLGQPLPGLKIDWKRYKEEFGSGYVSGLSLENLDDRNLIRAIQPIVETYVVFANDSRLSSVEKLTLAAADVAKRNGLDPRSILFTELLIRAWADFRAQAAKAIDDFIHGRSTASEVISQAVSPAKTLLDPGKDLN